MEEENKQMEEEINKIVVNFEPGTKIKETPKEEQAPPQPQETKHKKPRNHRIKIRLEGEPTATTKEESPTQEQIKPKRTPPTRKLQTEQEIKPVEPPKEEIKETPKEENIKVVKLVKCDKCNKSMTSKSLKYSHTCGEDKKQV